MSKKYDLIVYGATGYTGKFCVEYLAKYIKENSKLIKWAIAGRDERKLTSVKDEVSNYLNESLNDIDVIIANTEDQNSVDSMCAQCKVLINLVGPYAFHGEPVVKACIKSRTHQVDISGEMPFMEMMQIKYDEQAKDAGVFIVNACGFDSIPADMSVVYLSKHFDRGAMNSCEAYFTFRNGKDGNRLNHGTWDSLINVLANYGDVKTINDKLLNKFYPKNDYKHCFKVAQKYYPSKDNAFNRWAIPFWPIDRSIVSRSQLHYYNHNDERPIQFTSNAFIPWFIYLILLPIVGILFLLARFTVTRNLLLNYPEILTFGFVTKKGPTRTQTLESSFKMYSCGKGWQSADQIEKIPPNKTVKAVVIAMNPGYVCTSQCLIQSAMTLLEESDKIPLKGGILTPAVAFRSTSLIERLNSNSVIFKLLETDTKLI